MKQIVQNYRSGDLSVVDVPVPACKPGGVLVRSRYSLISPGTELMKVSEAKLSMLGKARARPDQVRKVVDSVAQVGAVAAYKKVTQKLDSLSPLGYSLSGVVSEVGRGAEEFKVGQMVACAGNEHALHAEVNWVPRNLCVPVPEGVEPRLASFATVGAIALHGVRRAEVQLGETACVIGLGLVGQLVTQLLVAARVQVVGLDPVAERCAQAETTGAAACRPPTTEGVDELERFLAGRSGGLGADHVFLTAGGSARDPVEIAARLARDRGRVVDIGKCRLDLPWNDYYEKELDVRFSRSYGPGRYDDRYELEGVDYPPGYVRWTERRNLACFLDLIAEGDLDLGSLVSAVFPLTEAASVYERLNAGELHGLGFLFEYAQPDVVNLNGQRAATPKLGAPGPVGRSTVAPPPVPGTGRLRVGFIGAGNYASSMLLPHLTGRDDIELAHVVTTTSLSAANAQRRFGFSRASTEAADILGDESIDTVFIVTRHHSHAELTARALGTGKTVFVEKPLALSSEEVDHVLAAVADSGNDRLMVGFNRRSAPLLVELRKRFGAQGGPGLVRYLVNAGSLSRTSWYAKSDTEGSRFEGEGGHFIDTVSWWLDADPVEVHAVATPGPGDLLVTLRFDDSSVATIAYATTGSPRFPKETFDAIADGRCARLDNFRRASVWTGRRRRTQRTFGGADKGQRAQVQAFLDAAVSGGPMPIPLPSLVATTRATLAVSRSQAAGGPVPV
jgi:predicted dehydrogenase/threonine dehydrogenase-like Zn-dependent dehydrogenase